MGDLYAGLYPSAKVMHNPALARRQSVVFGDIQDKLSDKMKEKMKVANVLKIGGTGHDHHGHTHEHDHSQHERRRNKIVEVL